MATITPEKASLDTGIAEFPAAPQESQESGAHTGPVARLLARVSKWSGDYAEYQMEACTWRKLAI